MLIFNFFYDKRKKIEIFNSCNKIVRKEQETELEIGISPLKTNKIF